MTKEQKTQTIEQLKEKFSQYTTFYFTDTESLTVEQINNIRRKCFAKNIEMQVAKNTLIKKALENIDSQKYEGAFPSLKGVTALFFTNNPKDPAIVVSDFRNEGTDEKRPLFKLASVDGEFFIGESQLSVLKSLKTKNELIAELIGLLNSPIRNVMSGIESSKNTLTGILSTLENKKS